MDGGAGKCGQTAGNCGEREIFRSRQGRLTARERFLGSTVREVTGSDEGEQVGECFSLSLNENRLGLLP